MRKSQDDHISSHLLQGACLLDEWGLLEVHPKMVDGIENQCYNPKSIV